MTFEPIALVNVYFMKEQEKCLVGRLASRDRQIFFEYHPEFITTHLSLSPFKLPLKSGIIVSDDRLFDGLFGVFNDSLPDGWGRLLLDRKLMRLGFNPAQLSPLDRLCYVGQHGMGALIYEPAIKGTTALHHDNLDEIAEEISEFQDYDNDNVIDDLLSLNGSSAGARPKILTRVEGEDWLIKFRSSLDPKDVGPMEYAYHLMAKEAMLDVPKAQLFASNKGPGYFGVQRFDRSEDRRLHMHTVCGLIHADHRIPSLDYEAIMKVTLRLTKNENECKKQFRVAVFNVLSHNRDDHAKNFSFLMNEQGSWTVSPSYDLTFSSGPNGEHCSTLMGEGKNPTQAHLLKLAEIGGIKKSEVLQIIDEVACAIAKWPQLAEAAGVSSNASSMIQTSLNQINHIVFT